MAQRVGRGIALLFHDRCIRRWVSGQQHAPAALYPRECAALPIVQEAEWAPGPVWTGALNLVPIGIRSRTVQPGLVPTGIRSRTVQPGSSVTIPTELPGPHTEISSCRLDISEIRVCFRHFAFTLYCAVSVKVWQIGVAFVSMILPEYIASQQLSITQCQSSGMEANGG